MIKTKQLFLTLGIALTLYAPNAFSQIDCFGICGDHDEDSKIVANANLDSSGAVTVNRIRIEGLSLSPSGQGIFAGERLKVRLNVTLPNRSVQEVHYIGVLQPNSCE